MRCWDGPLWNGVNTDYGESGIYREDFLKYIKPMTPEEAIAILWDYHHVKQELRPAELIFILGSNDIRVAEYAAELYARKLAPLLLFSGGMGRFTGEWAVPEAELFAEEAMKRECRETAFSLKTNPPIREKMSAFPALSWKSRHPGTIQHHRPSKALYGTAHAGYAPGPVAGSTGGGQLPSFLVQGISDQGAPAGSGCFRHGGGLSKDTGIS